MHTLSLGAGVQSSTLALLASTGVLGKLTGLPKPVAAIFADTGDEPESVYDWLDWLESEFAFPVIRLMRPGWPELSARSTQVRTSSVTGKTYLSTMVPAFALKAGGKKSKFGRQCTTTYKIEVVRMATKKLMKKHGIYKNGKSIQWIGISTDEAHRMKPSQDARIENIWPLLDIGWSRSDCLDWMKEQGYPEPPRSACVYCPYHSDAEWIRMRAEEPVAFAQAARYEDRLRAAVKQCTALEVEDVFLHASRVPLREVEFDEGRQLSLFGEECAGMCGV